MYSLDFSIIIPTYNNLELFKRAVDSVLIQKNVSYEVIVVDDSTNNNIEDYINKTDLLRIRYYHHKPSKGAVANWNLVSLLPKENTLRSCIMMKPLQAIIFYGK